MDLLDFRFALENFNKSYNSNKSNKTHAFNGFIGIIGFIAISQGKPEIQ